MAKFENKYVQNRKSPKNEDKLIAQYKKLNPTACKSDNYDIAAVKTKNGVNGHALLNESINRSKDKHFHIGKDFISDKELKEANKK